MFGSVTFTVVVHYDSVAGTDGRSDHAQFHSVVADRSRHDDTGSGFTGFHDASANFLAHGDTVAFVIDRAVESPAFNARTFQEGLTHRLAVFVTAGAKNNCFACLVSNFFTVLICNHADNFALVIGDKFFTACFVINFDLVCTGLNAVVKAQPECFAGNCFFFRAVVAGAVESGRNTVRIGRTINLVATVFSSREVGECCTLEAGSSKSLELRIQRLHPIQKTRCVVCPSLCETFGDFRLFAFEFAGDVFAGEHCAGVFFQGSLVSSFVRAVEDAAGHTSIRTERCSRLTFDNDNAGAIVSSRDSSCSTCTA